MYKITVNELEKKVSGQNKDIDDITSAFTETQLKMNKLIATIEKLDNENTNLIEIKNKQEDMIHELNRELEIVNKLRGDLNH